MKHIFTLFFASLFSIAAFARDEGKITITVVNKKNVEVYVDGRLYQDDENSLVLNNVKPGNHTIKIYKARNNGNARKNARNNEKNLLYSSSVYLRPSYHVDLVINSFGKAMVDERSLNDRSGNWEDDEWNDDSYDDGYRQPMSDRDFSQLLQRIRNQWFGRLGNAGDAVNTNLLSTTQVRQLLQLFTSESEKLDLAKVSYKNISDRQNFRQLYDLFSYQSQSELDRYTREYRQ